MGAPTVPAVKHAGVVAPDVRNAGADAPSRADRGVWLPLALLTLLALALRLYRLDSGLWVDEITALAGGFRGSFGDALTRYPGDATHPLYSVLTNRVIAVLGESAWSIRLVAVLFGVASVPALYLFAREVVSRSEALLAAALLTLSYHHIWFSQNARGYTTLVFFTLVATTLLLRALRHGRPALWVGFGVAAALGAYAHLTLVFGAVGQALAVGWSLRRGSDNGGRRADWPGAVLGFGTAAAVTVLLYSPMLPQVIDYFVTKPSGLVGVSSPRWALTEGLRVLLLGLGATGAMGVVVLLGGTIVVLAGTLDLFRRNATAALLMTLPVAVTLIGATIARGTMYPRFFFFLVGFALVIVVRGAMVTGRWIGRPLKLRPDTLGHVAIGTLLFGSVLALPFNYHFPKQDFGGALAYVERTAEAGDRVVTVGYPARAAYQQLYGKPWPEMASAADLARVRAAGRVWVLYSFPRYVENDQPDVWQVLTRECAVQRVFEGSVGGGDVVVCTLERS